MGVVKEYFCDICGERVEGEGSPSINVELEYVPQGKRKWVDVSLHYHKRVNGGKDIFNGELCLSCQKTILEKAIKHLMLKEG